MLRTISAERLLITSQRRSTTFSSVGKISFLKPIFLSSFQICSIGFISGVYGGMKTKRILSGTIRLVDLCQAAPSQHNTILSSGYFLDRRSKKAFIHAELQYGRTRKKDSPVNGSTAPYAYLYSRI